MVFLVREYVTFELRVVINFFTAKGKMATEIRTELVQMYVMRSEKSYTKSEDHFLRKSNLNSFD